MGFVPRGGRGGGDRGSFRGGDRGRGGGRGGARGGGRGGKFTCSFAFFPAIKDGIATAQEGAELTFGRS